MVPGFKNKKPFTPENLCMLPPVKPPALDAVKIPRLNTPQTEHIIVIEHVGLLPDNSHLFASHSLKIEERGEEDSVGVGDI